jgi:hypothetical protein
MVIRLIQEHKSSDIYFSYALHVSADHFGHHKNKNVKGKKIDKTEEEPFSSQCYLNLK